MAVSNGNDGKTKKEPLAACKFGTGTRRFFERHLILFDFEVVALH
jgi:hypothetical protein